MQYSTVLDTRGTMIYNIRLRLPRPQGPGRVRDLMPARNYQERSGYFSGSTTKTQSFQGATQSPPQPRRPQTGASRRLSSVPRYEAASPGLSFVRHLSRRPGHRSQREEILDNTVAFGVEFFSGRAGAALLARPLLFLSSRRPLQHHRTCAAGFVVSLRPHASISSPCSSGRGLSRTVGERPPVSPPLVPGVGGRPTQPCSEEGKSGLEGVPLRLPRLRCASPHRKESIND